MGTAGTSLAFSSALGLSSCTSAPPENIVPYVRAPEESVPGRPQFYATAMPFAGYGIGLIVQSDMGRPIKVDGNPLHSASLGASDAYGQSSVLDLYDPDRAQAITSFNAIRTWHSFASVLSDELDAARSNGGAGLRILTETVTSPTLEWQLNQFLQKFPNARWVSYEPIGGDNHRAGTRMAFGSELDVQYRMDRANVVLSLDSDFLADGPAHVRHTRDFSQRRKVSDSSNSMSRLYAAESAMTITGAMADHRFPVSSQEIAAIARTIASNLGINNIGAKADATRWPWLDVVFRDLQREGANSLVIAGSHQPPEVHAIAHAINDHLGNIGNTVVFTDPVAAYSGNQLESMKLLADEMRAGQVNALIIIGGNPVYTSPADLEFSRQLDKVRLRVHLGLYANETSERCQWHVPETHFLESWGDVRAFDGTATIIQPLINPLINGKSGIEMMATILGAEQTNGYDIVRSYWKQQIPDFDTSWEKSVRDGVIAGTASPLRTVQTRKDFLLTNRPDDAESDLSLEFVFRPDPCVFDGRYSNNGWLQELPKPLTKLTWDNAALISPEKAKEIGCANGDVVELRSYERSLHVPVWIQPGHARNSITLHLGYGRTRAGRTGNGRGFNAYAIRESSALWIAPANGIRKTGERFSLACTQTHQDMEGRGNVRTLLLADYLSSSNIAPESEKDRSAGSLYPAYPDSEYAWGMSIDLSSCIGCNACVVACQAENNIPIVGKQEVERGREMHWIRIDTYFQGTSDNPSSFFQPVPCMHCEDAPCEVVCPVGATTHSSEGLNEMTYNRCVGTRYCSNNCPYKVRRFNFFEYADYDSSSLKLIANPDVSVRSRGVMEKCTYCVQRINRARIDSEIENRSIRDGEIVTACQAACPANAIVFGNIRDPQSEVSKLKAQKRNYSLLEELNTRPRTTYLARLTNPNPEIGK
jgi:molybdopterin-containing oxidoreductase family iron-sulfur binding subunit